MGWNDIQPSSGGGGANYLKIKNNEQKLIHVISEEPHSFLSIFFNAIQKAAVVDPDNNPLKGVEGFEARKRHAILVYDYDDQKIKVLSGSTTLFNSLKELHQEWGNLQEIDVKIKRTGEGLQTKYTVLAAKDCQWDDSLIAGHDMPNLDEIFAITPEESVLAMSRGEDPSGEFDPATVEAGPAPEEAPVVDEIPEGEAPIEGEDIPVPSAPVRRPLPAKPASKPVAQQPKAPVARPAATATARANDRSAMLTQLKKMQITKKKYVQNPGAWITDLKKFGGSDKSSMSQLSLEALTKFFNHVKALA